MQNMNPKQNITSPQVLKGEKKEITVFPLVFQRKICKKSSKNFLVYLPPSIIAGCNASYVQIRLCQSENRFGLLLEFLPRDKDEKYVTRAKE